MKQMIVFLFMLISTQLLFAQNHPLVGTWQVDTVALKKQVEKSLEKLGQQLSFAGTEQEKQHTQIEMNTLQFMMQSMASLRMSFFEDGTMQLTHQIPKHIILMPDGSASNFEGDNPHVKQQIGSWYTEDKTLYMKLLDDISLIEMLSDTSFVVKSHSKEKNTFLKEIIFLKVK